ncbi:hypothetical protein J5N97_005619 [Dioscorea zingiberensis]|uniref:RNA-directed RNA polymerase n=1 Tax=Dioscorea zingiberensis TaxID=325984 RepID=A0A9D5DAL0_9LILI|nr:hypothetical protein J5N97_005619 [Dioscorea zingiberensis]
MVGKTIMVFGFPTSVTPTEVKDFLEKYVDEESVVAVKLRPPKVSKKRSRALQVKVSKKLSIALEAKVSKKSSRDLEAKVSKKSSKDLEAKVSKKHSAKVSKKLSRALEAKVSKKTSRDLEAKVSKQRSKALAFVQFSTSKHAEDISLIAQQNQLIYKTSTLTTKSAKRDIVKNPRIHLFTLKDAILHLGCAVSAEKFSFQWSCKGVIVDFGFDLRKIVFFISSESQSYKLDLSYDSIWEIKLLRSAENHEKFLLIQVHAAPRVYEMSGQNSCLLYEDPRFNYFKDIPDDQWIRTTDFTPLCSIGQSSAFCLQLSYDCSLPDISQYFVYYKVEDGHFDLQEGSSFSRSLDLVPIVEPSPGIEVPYKVLFKINHMVQNGTLMGPTLDRKFYELVSPDFTPINYIERALEDMSYLKSSCLDPANWLYERYQKFQRSPRATNSSLISLDSGLVYVHRVQVTPCKVYFYGPEINVSNRVLRHFSDDIDNFIRVSFVDEDGEKMHSTDLSPRSGNEKRTAINERMLSIMRNGLSIGDKKFEYLACSSSQLRESSMWMFASRPGLTAKDIRGWMGDFRKIRNVAKYAARLGQSFSSSTETLTVHKDEVEAISDVENKAGFVFSDGIGKISLELARDVAKKCDLGTSTPSAFQIRYGGYKGVVAVDPTSSMKLSLRKSMSKYESENNKLDVLAYSKYQPCYLNRQLITLLSTLGVEDSIFEGKQREAVEQWDKILVDPVIAQEKIEIMSPGETTNILKEMLLCGYKPDAEPFLSMLLQTFRATKLLELRTRSRIFIPKGRSMMGCMDETRTLKYGQVFVQVSCTGNKKMYDNGLSMFSGDQLDNNTVVVKGSVIVAKNPCLHPGDIGVLSAVDVPSLHHMVDCAVFPQKGKRPHPNECSGSDLDGDVYFVSWDPLLIPPTQDQPMDYTPAKPEILDHDVTIEEIEEYFVNYILNDSLGIIANAHTVFADKMPLKARSDECLELAKLFSIAVDFPKTGVPAVIPQKLRVNEYPDFMEKLDKNTYISEGVIGKLFREIKDRAPQSCHIQEFTREVAEQSYDHDMEVDGFTKYIDEASLYKDEYDNKLGNLMDQYEIKTEAEILIGSIMKASKSFSRYKDGEAIRHAVEYLRKEARGWFNEKSHDDEDEDDVFAKASAWYHVTYHPDYWGCNNEGSKRPHFLSFAWCVYDKLIQIKQNMKMRRAAESLGHEMQSGLTLAFIASPIPLLLGFALCGDFHCGGAGWVFSYEFLARYVDEESVVAVKLRLPKVCKRGSRAYAFVQFLTSKHATEVSLIAQQRRLSYGTFILTTKSAEHDIVQKPRIHLFTLKDAKLHLGCPLSAKKISVQWSCKGVDVDFGFNLRKIVFFISLVGQSYKLQLSYESIWEIQLLRSPEKQQKFLLIQVQAAPHVYELSGQNSGLLYEDPRFNFFKIIPDDQWIRTTDFTPLCSIGQSSAFCLQLSYDCSLPDISRYFYYYKVVDGHFDLQEGSSFSRSLDLVPIVEPSPGIEVPYKVLFKINHMVQNGTLMGPTLDCKFYKLVSPRFTPINHIERALEDMSYLKSSCLDPANWLYERYRKFQRSQRATKSSLISLDSGLVYVHRVQVTPCKVYFYGPEINVSNRVLRHFSEDIDNFIRVSFVDEDGEKMHSTDLSPRSGNENRTAIYERILSTMRNGMSIGAKKFEFLAFSSSQLRDSSTWMFASRPGLTAKEIRGWMGDFHKIRNVAKYAARLGQSFSSSTETLTVHRDEVEAIPDIENTAGHVFSDGIGKISLEFAREVAKKCHLGTSIPSAFQIRYGGYKGVVAVDPTSSMKLSLRKSMSKYESENNKLDVLAYSKYQPCYLNRQLITLLSTLGVVDAIFQGKQREAVEQLDKILVDPVIAQEAIEIMSPGETTNILKEMLLCGYKPDAEPFLSMLLQTFRATKLLELRTRSRIFIPKGRSMMGCMDETRTLKYGEVFVQVSCSGNKKMYDNGLSMFSGGRLDNNTVVIKGSVIVAKNPCLHPGDIRVLSAVDVPSLHHMVDCVVFPQKGKRPHPNECSGSDLDGDIYFVSWDPMLIPPSQDQPMDYTPAKPEILDHDVTIEEVEEYFVNYILNDSLGIIANAHTVFADKMPLKARSDECIELAKLFSIAVDFPKTGVPAVIPQNLRVKEYPDFMEKPDKINYISEGVMGKLFREIKDRAPQSCHIQAFTREVAKQSCDPDMEVDGFTKYINEASFYKDEYDIKLGNLMDHYEIKTEAEILSGSIMKASKSFNRYKDGEAIRLAVRSLRKETRGWFNEKSQDNEDEDDVFAKASAWYHVTYHPDYWDDYNQGSKRPHFLSFAWCVYDKLIQIKQKNMRMRRVAEALRRRIQSGLNIR